MRTLAKVEDSRRCRAALLQLGVRPRLAAKMAGSGRGPWYLARAKALSVGASNAYFRSLGVAQLIYCFQGDALIDVCFATSTRVHTIGALNRTIHPR
jgi:hypothetical protein